MDRHEHESPLRALALGLALSLLFVLIEAVTGVLSGSLALVSDAGHTLVDSAGLLLALAAATLARRPADSRRTYGYARFEVLAVPVHVALLFVIAGYILFESFSRLGGSHDIETGPVILVGFAGLAVNLLVLRLLHAHSHDNLNVRSARLEAAADAFSSVGVIVSAVAIHFGAWSGLDVLVALAIAGFILPRGFVLLRQAAEILLESTPAGIDLEDVIREGSRVEGVMALHDVHVWSIGPRFPALSAHVEVNDVTCTPHVLTELTALFRDRFGIRHVTLQPETRELHEAIECCMRPDAEYSRPEHVHVNSG